MTITVAVKPDLSAFREASEQDIIDTIVDFTGGVGNEAAIARALLAGNWIVPR